MERISSMHSAIETYKGMGEFDGRKCVFSV